ncbi:MAG: histidine kinase dimerization/phosphoacceptor domain -containing protein [Hyphomonadaceae bacterium]
MPEIMFQELADNAPVMIWRSGSDKLCNWFNQLWLQFVGRTLEQEVGYGWAEGVHPDDLQRCVETYEKAFDARQPFSMTYRLRRHDGVYRWLLDNGAPYYRGGQFVGYFGSCIDVSDERAAREQAEQALAERDALLREVYHRVKNNLQQIEGLIAIEAVTISDEKALYAMEALNARVRAMAAVHQKLIGSRSLTSISAREFISGLCADIAKSHGLERRKIRMQVEVDEIQIHIERAVILGLLINELATNACKHAFPAARTGMVSVRLVQGEDDALLEVHDDGIGVEPGSAFAGRSVHSGTRLIRGFIDQLDGVLTIDGSEGTRVRIVFPRAVMGGTPNG